MTTSAVILVLATFLASVVEAVEALTVVLAVGRHAWLAHALDRCRQATLALAAVIAIFGPALTRIPIDVLRLIIGTLLLIFGLQWLRKAMLRASGYKALRDEEALYAQEIAEARGAARRSAPGWIDIPLRWPSRRSFWKGWRLRLSC